MVTWQLLNLASLKTEMMSLFPYVIFILFFIQISQLFWWEYVECDRINQIQDKKMFYVDVIYTYFIPIKVLVLTAF